MQQNWKDIGFQIFEFMLNNACLSSIYVIIGANSGKLKIMLGK